MSCVRSCQARALWCRAEPLESQGTSLTWVSTSALAANKLGGLGQPPHHLSLHGFASEMGILTSNPQGQCMDSKG